MLHIFLNFILMLVNSVFIVFVCYSIWRWLDKKRGHKTSYQVTYEYMMFVLAKEHTGGSIKFESWERLKALGAEGWEIAQTIESDYDGISYILKRVTGYAALPSKETFHQS